MALYGSGSIENIIYKGLCNSLKVKHTIIYSIEDANNYGNFVYK